MKKLTILLFSMAFSIGFTNAQSRFGLGFGGQALKFQHETIGEDVGASQFRSATGNFDLGARIYGKYTINDNLNFMLGIDLQTWNLGYQTIHGKNESHYGIYAYNYFTGISYYKNFSNSRFGYSIGAELTISEFSGGADYNGNVPEGSRLY
ncbi:hypothetical protein MM236_12400 [Belliella sp. DSM 107340]|uniref:Outer membrane protein beta-barrel domain-containing protein n=1 Tax=Belliella calami TaxID=2923436 RepID=A0ABS9UQ85_9BACT|nr:hypothetical protein [Belliella calami]MCH7398796.1 hypothetical protein [Belliella calami]